MKHLRTINTKIHWASSFLNEHLYISIHISLSQRFIPESLNVRLKRATLFTNAQTLHGTGRVTYIDPVTV